MTVIAWDGTTLAADRAAGDGWMKCGSTIKIERVNDCLVGCAGSSADGHELVAWFRNGPAVDTFPSGLRGKESVKMLVITPDKRVLVYDNSPYPTEYCDSPDGIGKRQAIGSGREAAMAAMLAGCGARRAVEIASLVCLHIGNGVDTLEL